MSQFQGRKWSDWDDWRNNLFFTRENTHRVWQSFHNEAHFSFCFDYACGQEKWGEKERRGGKGGGEGGRKKLRRNEGREGQREFVSLREMEQNKPQAAAWFSLARYF